MLAAGAHRAAESAGGPRPPVAPTGTRARRVEGWRVLTPTRRVLYSLGTFGSSLLQQTVLLWVFYFYAPPPDQGLPARVAPALVGRAMGLGRVVDAFADPLVAHWSDRLRWRAGRRRPFILAGAPVLALAFALVWGAPGGPAPPAPLPGPAGPLGAV